MRVRAVESWVLGKRDRRYSGGAKVYWTFRKGAEVETTRRGRCGRSGGAAKRVSTFWSRKICILYQTCWLRLVELRRKRRSRGFESKVRGSMDIGQ
jgi:hypothetical protein